MADDGDLHARAVRSLDEAHERSLARRRHDRARRHGGFTPLAAAVVVGGAVALSALLGRRYSPDRSHPDIDRWYDSLEKPPFTPPDPVFAAVWPALEGLLAISGYRLLRGSSSPDRDWALGLWAVNLAMIPGWTKIFFGERSPTGGVAAAAAELAAGLAFIEKARRVDGAAAACAVPYAAWLGFATVLAEEIWRRNQAAR